MALMFPSLARSLNLEISRVVWQTTSENSTEVRAARGACLFFIIQPIRSMICGDVVAFPVVVS